MKFSKFYLLLAFVAALTSCSVEKRQHTGGYHVEWYSWNNNAKKQVDSDAAEKPATPVAVEQNVAVASQEITPSNAVAEVAVVEAAPVATINEVTAKAADKTEKAERKSNKESVKKMINFGSSIGAVGLAQEGTKAQGLGVAGMVCGIVGLVFCWVPFFGFILSLLGCVMGGVQLSKIKKSPESYGGKGQAITGLVLGVVGLAIGIALTIAILAAVSTVSGI